MKTSTLLRIYRVTTFVLLVALALMPLIYRRDIIFATSATVVITLVLILIAFRCSDYGCSPTIAKLDELLELLRHTKRALSRIESKQLQQKLEEIRARFLQDKSFKRSKS